jgi:hypothetical protein
VDRTDDRPAERDIEKQDVDKEREQEQRLE